MYIRQLINFTLWNGPLVTTVVIGCSHRRHRVPVPIEFVLNSVWCHTAPRESWVRQTKPVGRPGRLRRVGCHSYAGPTRGLSNYTHEQVFGVTAARPDSRWATCGYDSTEEALPVSREFSCDITPVDYVSLSMLEEHDYEGPLPSTTGNAANQGRASVMGPPDRRVNCSLCLSGRGLRSRCRSRRVVTITRTVGFRLQDP